MRQPWPGLDLEHHLAFIGEDLVGWAELSFPLLDNRDAVLAELEVHPGYRRRGIGTALAGCLTERAGGYEVVSWRGSTPAEHVKDLAVLVAHMSTDPPLGDLMWEPEAVDPVRLRASEVVMDDRGLRRWTTAVRPVGGPLVGFTQVFARASQHEDADQGDTIVLSEHRGHRLGALIKGVNLALVRADMPALRRIWTWNAAENSHMVSINEAMGFHRHRKWFECQLRLP